MRYHIRLVSYSNTHHLTELSPNAKSRSFKDSFHQTLCCSQSIDFAVSRWLSYGKQHCRSLILCSQKNCPTEPQFPQMQTGGGCTFNHHNKPISWLIGKARSQAEHPCYLLNGQEMLPQCLCCVGCHSFKHHLSVLAAPTSCYRR